MGQPVLLTQLRELQEMSNENCVEDCPSKSEMQAPPGCWSTTTEPMKSSPSRGARKKAGKNTADTSEGANVANEIAEELRTTVMLRSLPLSLTRDELVKILDHEGFARKYDFVYVPIEFTAGHGMGYAFVNMTSPEIARCLFLHFEGFSSWATPSDEICTVTWSNPLQGLAAHVQRYRDSPIMHRQVPEAWKPLLFVNNQRVRFPPPTKRLKAPKFKLPS